MVAPTGLYHIPTFYRISTFYRIPTFFTDKQRIRAVTKRGSPFLCRVTYVTSSGVPAPAPAAALTGDSPSGGEFLYRESHTVEGFAGAGFGGLFAFLFGDARISDALMRYCSGLSSLMTEKKPSETARCLCPPSTSPFPMRSLSLSGISPQQRQQQQRHSCGSTTLVPSITGSATSTTAVGLLVLISPSQGTEQKLSDASFDRKILTSPSPP